MQARAIFEVPRAYQVEAAALEARLRERQRVLAGPLETSPLPMTNTVILNCTVARTRVRDPDSPPTGNLRRSLPRLLHFESFERNRRLGAGKRCRCVRRIACSLQLPLLPFNINEILVPSERKTLHLFEARYLSLLDESLLKKKKLFVHFVLDPIAISSASGEASFAARYGCLVLIENVERLDVGALVSIRGIGRIKILKFIQADPYLIGEVIPMRDQMPDSLSKVSSKIKKVREAIHSLNSLEIKLKAPNEALLQTQITNSLLWAEMEPSFECNEGFIPPSAERLSFAALQPITGSTQLELQKLQRQKLKAMDLKDTHQRLEDSLEIVKENISVVAAKLAIQSLEIQ